MAKRFLFGLGGDGAGGWRRIFVATGCARRTHHGRVYRIFFLHVSCAWAGLTAFFDLLSPRISCTFGSARKNMTGLAVRCAEVGLGIYNRGVNHRARSGPNRHGNLLDLGCSTDVYVHIVGFFIFRNLLLRTLVEEADRRALLSALSAFSAFIDVSDRFRSNSLVAERSIPRR